MTIQITKPELEALIHQRLQNGGYKDAEDVILHALRVSSGAPPQAEQERIAAIERLASFGKRHGLSLGGMTIQELRREARP